MIFIFTVVGESHQIKTENDSPFFRQSIDYSETNIAGIKVFLRGMLGRDGHIFNPEMDCNANILHILKLHFDNGAIAIPAMPTLEIAAGLNS